MRLALAQINPTIGDFSGNRSLILEYYEKAAAAGAALVVFPELALTGYPPRDLLERAAFREAAAATLAGIVPAVGECGLLLGAPLPAEDGLLHNAAVLLHRGRILATVPKQLLPVYDVFDEHRYFKPGGFSAPVPFAGERLGITICEDAWRVPGIPEAARYPHDPVAALAQAGATLLLNLSASPFHGGKTSQRRMILRHHAANHGIPCALVNQVGGNDELIFDGNSLYVDPHGSCRQLAPFAEECRIVETREQFADEPEPADAIGEIGDALVLGIRDYARKCGFREAVIGLSGGIDSALTAALACRALGPEQVTGITMPSIFSSPGSVSDSEGLARNLGMRLHRIPIAGIVDAFDTALAGLRGDAPPGLTEENIQARIRGTLLMAHSNRSGALLLSTGNKSELSMGYCTLYGDMNGGLAVLGDLLKTTVYALARHLNAAHEVIPWNSIEKPPSAELRPGQLDSDSLPPYPVLDRILHRILEEGYGPQRLVASGEDPALVTRILQAIDRNEYKRWQAPPVLRVTSKAFGSGRRIPLAARFLPPDMRSDDTAGSA